jgi:hypothetical protein
MPEPLSDLPRFPEDQSRKYEDAMAELDRRTAANQADAGGFDDWLRHTWPAFALVGFGLVAAALLLVAFGSVSAVLVGIPAPPLTLLCVYLAWRGYRHRPE